MAVVDLGDDRRRAGRDQPANERNDGVGAGEIAVRAGDHHDPCRSHRELRERRSVAVAEIEESGGAQRLEDVGRLAAAGRRGLCEAPREQLERGSTYRRVIPRDVRGVLQLREIRGIVEPPLVGEPQHTRNVRARSLEHRERRLGDARVDPTFGHDRDRHVEQALVDGVGGRLLHVLVELRQRVVPYLEVRAHLVGVVLDVVDLALEVVDDRAVDHARADEDAEPEGKEHRDERDQVEAEVDHRPERSLGRRPRAGGARQNQPVTLAQPRSHVRRKPSRNTCSE